MYLIICAAMILWSLSFMPLERATAQYQMTNLWDGGQINLLLNTIRKCMSTVIRIKEILKFLEEVILICDKAIKQALSDII